MPKAILKPGKVLIVGTGEKRKTILGGKDGTEVDVPEALLAKVPEGVLEPTDKPVKAKKAAPAEDNDGDDGAKKAAPAAKKGDGK